MMKVNGLRKAVVIIMVIMQMITLGAAICAYPDKCYYICSKHCNCGKQTCFCGPNDVPCMKFCRRNYCSKSSSVKLEVGLSEEASNELLT
ncbi:hypothetical protein CASFOL_026004 [Castilleja foliolosa]|uniref:Uncharacterized protein n=1 Tax=Castilleja foliolosa TaxID=1961234 RepID=A0ABD3CSR8_9LAMI